MAGRSAMTVEARRVELLRRLALDGGDTVESMHGESTIDDGDHLGDKTRALVGIAAVIASSSSPASYQWAVTVALSAGALHDEVIDVLLAVAHIVGQARVTAAAPALAAALGYEIDRDFCDPS